jgi:hypothetical protein
VSRFSAPLILVAVTPLLLVYGRFPFAWVAGPAAALGVWALDRKAREPAAPAPAREPVPVD